MTTKPKVVFFGSGPVAAESLERLSQHCDVEAVVTKPRPAHHRGDFPVLSVCERMGLPIHTVSSKAELTTLLSGRPFLSRVGVLIDFGIIIGQDCIDYFEKGIVNSHFSLLPQWRGADPITFAILSGQSETGVSLMLLVAKMDEGPLLAQTDVAIGPKDTTPSLTRALIEKSDALLQVVLPQWLEGTITPGDQLEVTMLEDNTPTYSRKLTKADGRIDWHKPATQIEREIRAFIEWPKSYTTLGSVDLTVTAAHVIDESGEPGTYKADNKELVVYCSTEALSLDHVKPAGKPAMSIEAFLNGYRALL